MRALLQRLLQTLGVLIGICAITFLLIHAAPGDPARLIAGDRASPETIAAVRHEFGLDRPLHVQFLDYMTGIAQGDIGKSLRYKRPVVDLIGQFMWPTLFLIGYSIFMSVPAALFLAERSARRPGGILDQGIRLVGVAGMAIPVFWLGLMMSRLFGVALGWFPVSGYGRTFADHLYHLFLPALSIAVWMVPILTQSLRAALIDKGNADYVTAARALGASDREVFWRTVLPNAVLPTLNLFGVLVAFLIGGTIVVETVFVVPGLGSLMIGSLLSRDYNVVQGLTLAFAAATTLVTFAVDLLTVAIDPRGRA